MRPAARAAEAPEVPLDVEEGSCTPLDLVFVIDETGSMGQAIDSVKAGLNTIVATAEKAAAGDLRLALVTFRDEVTVRNALTEDIDAVRSSIDALSATAGGGSPEASDEAKNTVVNNLPGGPRMDSLGNEGMQVGDFTTEYRPDAEKLVVLVTDAPPAGFDDGLDAADAEAMHAHAETALEKGILISDVFVPTDGDYAGQLAMLEDDAVTSGGAFTVVSPDGTGTGEAINIVVEACGRGVPALPETSSTTQPAAELVLFFDATENKTSFVQVSNIGGVSPDARQITTHWVFWSESCDELVDVSMCLTLNDTVVVDPRSLWAIGPENERMGPEINLDGERGLITVTAYETDEECSEFRRAGSVLRDDAIVGAFTIADQEVGYAFGRDAEGFGTNNPLAPTRIVLPPVDEDERFLFQVLDPTSVDASLVVLAHLRSFDVGPAEPVKEGIEFSTTFTDSLEVAVSLPDTSLTCAEFTTLAGGLIPDTVTTNSSGILSLQPIGGLEEGDALLGIVGQAVGRFGAGSGLKSTRGE